MEASPPPSRPVKTDGAARHRLCSYDVRGTPRVGAGVYVKHLLTASRGHKVSQLAFQLDQGGANLRVNVDCESGLQKSYAIPTLETECLQASADAGAYPVKMTADSAEMGRLLSGFHGALEITVIAEPSGPGKCCRFQSFYEPSRAADDRHQPLYTEVSLDTSHLMQTYSHAGSGPLDATFNLKDFKIMVSLCSAMEAQVALHLAGPGAPVISFPRFPPEHPAGALGYSAELVLASLEVAPPPEEVPAGIGRTAAAAAATATGAGRGASKPPAPSAADNRAMANGAGSGRVSSRGGWTATDNVPSSSVPGASAHGPGTQRGAEGIMQLARGGMPAESQRTLAETVLSDSEVEESPPPGAHARQRGSGELNIPRVLAGDAPRVLAGRKRGLPEASDLGDDDDDVIPASPPRSPLCGF